MEKLKLKGVMQGRRNENVLEALVNMKTLGAQCARSLHDGILAPTILYRCETLVLQGPERSMLRAVRMDTLIILKIKT